jgi:hypothetical protein
MRRHRNRRLTVEECRIFDIGSLKEALNCVDFPTNCGKVSWSGASIWQDPFGGTEAVLDYSLGRVRGEGLILLTDPERTTSFPTSVRLLGEYEIPITTTPTRIGGVRYWFCCPVEHDRKPCSRRVKRLYLPPGEEIFGCRQCHDLTYRSAQQHDQRRYDLARDPDALNSALKSEDLRRAGLGIGALVLRVKEMQKHAW